MTNRQTAAQLYTAGKISAWNSRGDRDVRVLIGREWVKLTPALIASMQ